MHIPPITGPCRKEEEMGDRLLTDEWQNGADAWECAGSDATNPHEPGTPEHRDWQAGYDTARRAESAQ